MQKPLIPAIANFFLPGLGYLLAGIKRPLAVLWLVGVIGLTYVEFGIRDSEPTLYSIMFVSVLIMNVAFAVDVYQTLKSDQPAAANLTGRRDVI